MILGGYQLIDLTNYEIKQRGDSPTFGITFEKDTDIFNKFNNNKIKILKFKITYDGTEYFYDNIVLSNLNGTYSYSTTRGGFSNGDLYITADFAAYNSIVNITIYGA